jgi:hypothetical protein
MFSVKILYLTLLPALSLWGRKIKQILYQKTIFLAINTNAINKVTMYGRRLGRPQAPVAEGGPGHSWRRTLLQVPPPTGGGNTRRPCHPSKEHPPMNSSPNAPWKEGRERSDRWKETPTKGFLPRVSDGTGSPGPGGCGRPKRRPNGDVIYYVDINFDIS